MLIDCSTCVARDLACGDCVVTVLLASPPPCVTPHPARSVALDEGEQAALGALARAGLVPPLRLVHAVGSPPGLSDTA